MCLADAKSYFEGLESEQTCNRDKAQMKEDSLPDEIFDPNLNPAQSYLDLNQHGLHDDNLTLRNLILIGIRTVSPAKPGQNLYERRGCAVRTAIARTVFWGKIEK